MNINDKLARLIPTDEALWLRAQIDAFWKQPGAEDEYNNVDNVRLAEEGNAEDELEYDEAVCNGCCGSVDVKFGPSPAGRTYFYGFNHGH